MMPEKRKELAELITAAVFDFDPYNGADADEMTAYNLKQLRTLSGCYEIIDGLCQMLKEA